jgi:hypothetical protein
MDTTNIILACSTLFGPVISAFIAIYYTRYADKQKIKNARRFEVYRNLMKTRGFQLHPDHVMSLNLIQSDFNDDTDVMTKFREYIDHLYRPVPTDEAENQRFSAERDLLFGKLLVSIANSLSINIDASEVQHFKYSPMGWASVEIEQQQLRRLLMGVLQGLTPIFVKPFVQESMLTQGQSALFPGPPK